MNLGHVTQIGCIASVLPLCLFPFSSLHAAHAPPTPFEQRELLRKEFKIDLRILGIASSKKMLLKESGIDLDDWKAEFEAKVRVLSDVRRMGRVFMWRQ